MISATLTGKVAAEEFSGDPRGKEVDFTVEQYPETMFTQVVAKTSSNRFFLSGSFAANAPIGEYELCVSLVEPVIDHPDKQTRSKSCTVLIVLVNPYHASDLAHTSSSNLKEYVEGESGLVWQGLSDNNNGFGWDYDQFKYENLQVATDRLFRLHVADRGDLVTVSRHLTYSIGEDVCYGKWGGGSYTSGRPSGGYTCNNSPR